MRFGLNEDQELLQETVRGFIEGECPAARLREIFDAGSGHDDALWNGMAEMGLAGLVVPEEYGGAGLDVLELALVSETLGGGALPSPFLGHSLACLAIARGGSDEQRRRWLPELAAGKRIGTLAFAEPNDLWEPEDWKLSASGSSLDGTKTHVPHAAIADVLVVGLAGGDLGVVDREDARITVEDQGGIDRTRPIGRVTLARARFERLGGGAAAARRVRDAGLSSLAADSFGAATRLIQLCVDYAKSRKQFGLPIAQFQSVKHQIARIATEIEPTRALFWYAAHALDRDLEDAERSAAMAKAHITDRAMQAAREAVELHGGIGFTWECDVQMWFKRAMFNRAFLGTPDAHRERCAALAGW